MKSSGKIHFLFIFSILSTAILWAQRTPAQVEGKSRAPRSAPKHHQEQHAWEMDQRTYPLGHIPHGARARALTQIQSTTRTPPPAPQWVNIGPAPFLNTQITPMEPTSGRVTAIAVDPTNNAHWLIGAAMGGVWESRDTGVTWTPKTDSQASLAMGALAFAPGNPAIIYAGTGEPNFKAGDDYYGAGLLKSVDGGATWQLLGTANFTGLSFAQIVVNPANANILVAAVTGGGAGRGDEGPPFPLTGGIFTSSNGGTNWTQMLNKYSTDVKADPSNFNHLLATISQDGVTGFEIAQSTNGGAGWTTYSFGPWVLLGSPGRMQLAISPSNPNTAYVSITDVTGDPQNNTNYFGLLGIWRTDNAWGSPPTWTRLPQPQGGIEAPPQLWYAHVISVDPANPNVVYFGENELWKYNGTTWTVLGAMYLTNNGLYTNFHPDQHAMAWAGNRLIFGNDGGVWSTTNGGAAIFNHNTNNLAITQFYYGAAHPQGRSMVLAGAQDNGTELWQGSNTWSYVWGGDGAEAAFSPSNPDNDWAVSFDKLATARGTGAGQYVPQIFAGGNLPNVPFIGRLAFSPANENILLTANSAIQKCTTVFSCTNVFPGPYLCFFQDSKDLGARITAIAFAPSDVTGNTYAFATADGQIWLTTTGTGNNAVSLNAGGEVPFRYLTQVAFQPNNANVLYVTLSGFDEATPYQPGHVFKTSNALSPTPAWVNVTPGGVDLPCNALAIDPASVNNVYVGTDIGVWKSTDGGGTWTHQGPEIGMPNVAVFDLKVQPNTGRIFAFTHGRSTFMYDPNAANNLPTITSFIPTNGPPGATVTIAGTEFNSASAVAFGGVSTSTFTVNSSTQIVASVPAAAVTGPISVTTPGGTATSAASFLVSNSPAITGFSPASGNVGTIVTISGANFTGTTNVSFNSTAATSFTVNSATQITATVPAGATTGKIAVTSPTGTGKSGTNFTVTTLPVISGFSPTTGAIGSSVVITGANFVGVTNISFNGTAASATVNSSAQITATVPPAATSGPISVATTNGTAQSAGSFTVIPAPVITSFAPTNGSYGTAVTISGSNFAGASAVTFNGANALAFTAQSATLISATAPAGVSTGPVGVTTPGGTAASATSFIALAPPSNDIFVNAQLISGPSGTVFGTNIAATQEPGEPAHAGNDGGKSIWYRWTAPSSGTWTFNTAGSTFDTLLAVYTGSAVSNLTQVASNDNVPGTNTSSVSFNASGGTVYQIAVDGFLGDNGEGAAQAAPASGTVELNWNLAANFAPQIVSFSPAGGSVGTVVTVSGVNLLGTTGVTFSAASASFNASSNFQITATVPSGATTGPIQVSSPAGTAVSASSFIVGTGPLNDNFANAQAITGNAGTVIGSSAGATKEPNEPNHAGNTGGASVWYQWTAPLSGPWEFDTFGSSFNTLLGIYTGTSVSGLTLVVSNDNANGTVQSQVYFNAAAGTNYYIAVDGYNSVTGNVTLNWANTNLLPMITSFNPTSGGVGALVTINGTNLNGTTSVKFAGVGTATFTNISNVQLTATVPAGAGTGPISITTPNGSGQSAANFTVTANPPPNDNFSNRIAIVGAVRTVTGSNLGATKEAGEPNHAGNAGGASVWWTWTAPSNGTYAVTTRDSSFATLLGVYTGTSVSALTTIASNDEGPNMGTASLVAISATGGTAYQIAVDGFNAASGSVVLSVYPTVVASNIFYTGFEASEGYTNGLLVPQKGWVSQGYGLNGILTNIFSDYSQQAYVGYYSPSNGSTLYVYQPFSYSPNTNTLPIVVFSTYMAIADSTNLRFDDFGWAIFNEANTLLFFLDFNNSNLTINYLPNDNSGYHPTGFSFRNDAVYYLQITMDFGRNLWSATLGNSTIVQNQPLSAASGVALNLKAIAATWFQTSGTYGNNSMIFDNYSVSAQPSYFPRFITQPQNTSVQVGNNTNLLVVADSPLPLSYQWLFNGAALPGSTAPVLALNNVTFSQAGSYSVVVTNTSGSITSSPAALTVTALPNLTPYKPTGWSDKIVTATNALSSGTNALDASIIYASQDIYVNWAVANLSSNGNVTATFYNALYVDGVLKNTWNISGLPAFFFAYVPNYDVGKLSYGQHTLQITADTTGVVPESNENDNSYIKTIIVSSTNNIPPLLSAPSRSPNGSFQFNLTGIPLRSYQFQASTNFTNWTVLSTLVDSNGNGLIQFSDPTATNFNRRFYRSELLSP